MTSQYAFVNIPLSCVVAENNRITGVGMHWGDAQAIFQLIIGINAAFFSFREIRRPVEEKEQKNLSRFNEYLSSRIDATSIEPQKDSLDLIRTRLVPLYNAGRRIKMDTKRFDDCVETGALTAVIIGTVELFRSAYQYGQIIEGPEQMLLFLGYLPSFGAIGMNMWTIGRTRREMTKPRLKLGVSPD